MIEFQLIRSGFRGFTRTYRARVNHTDPYELYQEARPEIYSLLNESIAVRIRIIICLSVLFYKTDENGQEITQTYYFCSLAERILSRYQIDAAVGRAFERILTRIENFTRNGSNWNIKEIRFVDVHVGNYRADRGGCRNAKLPSFLKHKKAILNIKNKDNKCFLYCIAASLYPHRINYNRCSYYTKYFKRFKFEGIDFPITLSGIKLFERLNKLKINIYGVEGKEIYPYYVSERKELWMQTELLFYENHYYLITNFNRFMHTKDGLYYYCKRCLSGFSRAKTLISHKKLCGNLPVQKVSMPADKILKFTNLAKCSRHPFCIYADFEALTKKVDRVRPSETSSYTVEIERHEAASYSIIATDLEDRIIFHQFFCGKETMKHFFETLKYLANKLLNKMHEIMPMSRPVGQDVDSSICHICKELFVGGEIRVQDHNHFTGEPRGMAHRKCNILYKKTYFLPVLIHNSRNYDAHLILKSLPENYAESIEIIPMNMEKITCFTLDSVKFIDSYQFLDASLDTLVKNLIESGHQFKIFNQFFKDEPQRHLLLRKGIFPYSYFDNFEKLKDPVLPPKQCFFNVLTNTEVSDVDYDHAQHVYSAFKCKNFSQYLELYQNVDTLLLAEVFSAFRNSTLNSFELDPVHFISAAELSWNAGMKFTKAELELLGDVDTYIWFESQMRGGITYLGKRYSKANNPFLPNYDSTKPNNYILALDVNNLYGFVMTQRLPLCNFSWLRKHEIVKFDPFKYDENSPVGFILEVDLDYPAGMHNDTNDLPFAVQHLDINYDMLSPYSKKLCDKFDLKHTLPCKKLTPNFYPKKNYVCHYLNLKYYLERGMVLKKIHRILSFSQSAWLKPYVVYNNEKRLEASDDFSKSLYKKFNNSLFGRLMMNVRKRINMKAALEENTCQRLLSSPLLEYFEIVNENFTLFKMKKPNLVLDKPIYAGFCILEMSKLHMYRLLYDNFKKFYGENCSLLYMDTDSLYLDLKTDNAYEDLKTQFAGIMDFSNFDKNSSMYDCGKKGHLGLLKSETALPIQEFAGLRAKCYAFSYGDNAKMTAKGVKNTTVKTYNLEKYKSVLFDELQTRETQYSILSKQHNLMTVEQRKVGLSCYYDKKYVLDDGINCLAYGHYQID